ncbi:MAG: GH25 family lysozyme [Christensenellales bacterium]|jgi:lysozyme
MKTIKKIIFLAITIFIVCCLGFQALAFEPFDPNLKDGIDVSRWQGEIDFEQVYNSGVEVVYIRSSLGETTDIFFHQNYENARAAGLSIGFYHAVTARNVQEARIQARYFASVIADTQPNCMPAMNFELFTNLSNSEINAISEAFMETLQQESGLKAVLYTNTYTATNILSRELTKYPLWIAQYGPPAPGPNGKWDVWVGWQYSDSGSVPGISGAVDLDYYTKDIFLKDTPDPPDPPAPDYVYYTVRTGDTLSGIAQRYRTTVASIVSLNHIANPDLIYTGEVLKILPGDTPDPPAPDYVYYTVRTGDTLSGIAQRYHTTVAGIVSLNHIANPDLIYTGEVLKILPG